MNTTTAQVKIALFVLKVIEIVDKIKAIIKKVINRINAVIEDLEEFVGKVIEKIMKGLAVADAFINDKISWVLSKIQIAIDFLKEKIAIFMESIKAWYDKIMNGIKTTMIRSAFIKLGQNPTDEMINGIAEGIPHPDITSIFPSIEINVQLPEISTASLTAMVESMVTGAVGSATGAVGAVKDGVGAAIGATGSATGAVGAATGAVTENASSKLFTIAKIEMPEAIKDIKTDEPEKCPDCGGFHNIKPSKTNKTAAPRPITQEEKSETSSKKPVKKTKKKQSSSNNNTASDDIPSGPPVTGQKVVILDPGHGSDTPGKRSPDKSILEYKWNRMFVNKLIPLLQQKGFVVINNVKESTEPTINARIKRANGVVNKYGINNCIFVSIHINAAASDGKWHNATGWSVYTNPNRSRDSLPLAKHIANAHKKLKVHCHGNQPLRTHAEVGVIKSVKCPTVLTENLFMDTKSEVNLLKNDNFVNKLVTAHVNGICNYFDSRK